MQWDAPAWVVVATDYQADSIAQRRLDNLGLDARLFVVRRTLPANRVRPATHVLEPAFPGYLIVRCAPHERDLLRRDYKHGIDGPLTAVGDATKPALLPDLAMLEMLRLGALNLHAQEDGMLLGEVTGDGSLRPVPRPDEPVPDLTGETLLVADPDSPFAGFSGECMRSGPDRVVILLRLLGADRRVALPRAAVRRA